MGTRSRQPCGLRGRLSATACDRLRQKGVCRKPVVSRRGSISVLIRSVISHPRSYHEPAPLHESPLALWWIYKGDDRIPSWQARDPRHQSTFAPSFCPPRQTVLELSAAEHKREESIYTRYRRPCQHCPSSLIAALCARGHVRGRQQTQTLLPHQATCFRPGLAWLPFGTATTSI